MSRVHEILRGTFKVCGWKFWARSAHTSSALLVEDTVGFKHVDAHVTTVMITWIGDVMEQTCKELLACSDVTDRFDQMETSTSTIEAKTLLLCGCSRLPSVFALVHVGISS